VLGKKVKALRRAGVTPANIYGHNVDSVAIQVPTEDLKHVIKTAGRNEIVYLRLDGDEPRPTFVRDIQHHPVADRILHVDFFQISLKEKVRMDVPIHLLGVPPAVDTYGGILVHGLDHISVEALPTDVPSAIEIDVSVLAEIDQAVHVSDLVIPEDVTLLTDPEQVVAKVSPPAVEIVEEVEEEEAAEGEEGEEAAEAPAEGAAEEEEKAEE
jgi:large subunit ribosomal protein L25